VRREWGGREGESTQLKQADARGRADIDIECGEHE